MSKGERYPQIPIRSKSELAKHISGKNLSRPEALALINDVLKNFDAYWEDHKEHSEPEKQKWVRNAAGKPLGKLLKLIDRKVLAPYDDMVPGFIFGGLKGKNHLQAARHLLGKKKQRTLRSLDITRFYEQISEKRVFYFFHKKAGCSVEAARLLARLCCVARGPKGSVGDPILARGFATSARLALWCNLDTFLRVEWKAKHLLAGHDARVAVYVDDVGITASDTSKERMEEVSVELENILLKFDDNQPLPIQPAKAKTYMPGTAQHLGLQLGRNRMGMGTKSQRKYGKIVEALKTTPAGDERKALKKKRKSYLIYRRQIKKVAAQKAHTR